MWKEILYEIELKEKKYNSEFKFNIGAESKEIEIIKSKAKEKFNVELPVGYINLLKLINGLESDGCILYGIDQEFLDYNPNQYIHGILDSNDAWRYDKEQEKYIFIGDSSISWFVYNIVKNKYFILDKPSGSEMGEFDNIEDMLEEALREAL